jgi:hypothetical protein
MSNQPAIDISCGKQLDMCYVCGARGTEGKDLWMEEPICDNCNDTGDSGTGYLDCGKCDAALILGKHGAINKQ